MDYINRSDLVLKLSLKTGIDSHSCAQAVQVILREIGDGLAHGQRTEIRGFGSFSLHTRAPRLGRNPKTGQICQISEKKIPHFRAGAPLRMKVDPNLKNKS